MNLTTEPLLLPSPPNGKQDLSSEYYHVRSYQDFINMINKTLMDLFRQLPFPAGYLSHYNPLHMEWDNSSCTATLYADSCCFDLKGASTPAAGGAGRARKFEIYFDARLYQLFSTLNATYVGNTSTPPSFYGIQAGRLRHPKQHQEAPL